MPRSEGRQGAPEAFIAPGAGGRGTGACRGPGGQAVGRPQGAEAGDTRQAFALLPITRGGLAEPGGHPLLSQWRSMMPVVGSVAAAWLPRGCHVFQPFLLDPEEARE